MASILDQTIAFLKNHHANRIASLQIEDVRVGLFLSAIRLSDGSSGMASTVYEEQQSCDKDKRDFGDFSPNQIRGRSVLELLETTRTRGVINTLRIAALNAISSSLLQDARYQVQEDTDPFDLLDLSEPRKVVLIGAFQTYINRLADSPHQLQVLELNEQALQEKHRRFFVPAADYGRVLPEAGAVAITGFSLVNRTFDDLLGAVSPKAQVIVTGPSASLLPDVLFENGVSHIGATRVTDPELLFRVVAEGGSGYHLFRYCARKICISKNELTPGPSG